MIEQLKEMICSSEKIVFFGGAGVSTESGIPDFRSVDGLYHQTYQYPPETILSRTFFERKTKEFYEFYRDKMICLDAKPNDAHKYLVSLEQEGKLSAIVTQNIDNLHYMAGSKIVYELHGNVHRNYCRKCHKFYDIQAMLGEGLPTCQCGGVIKPDVVLYEEGLPEIVITKAVQAIAECDMLIIAGTSLAVYPAASFIEYYRGNKLVVINKSELSLQADLVIQDAVGKVFHEVSRLN
ncbi:MAG: NAD-dependent protein deacylase [Eubacteriales bacterium]